MCPCNLNNTALQIIGRGSRALFSGDTAVMCHVSFDSSGELAESKNGDGEVVRYVERLLKLWSKASDDDCANFRAKIGGES